MSAGPSSRPEGLAALGRKFAHECAPVQAIIVEIRRFVLDNQLVSDTGEALDDEEPDAYEAVLWDGVEGSAVVRCILARRLHSLARNYYFQRGVVIEIFEWCVRMLEVPMDGQPNQFTLITMAEHRRLHGPDPPLPPAVTTARERPLAGSRSYFVHHFCDDCFVGADWQARDLSVPDEELDGLRFTTVRELARATVPPPRRVAKGKGKGRGGGCLPEPGPEQSPFLGRVVGKSGINHYARVGEKHKTPFFCTFRVVDMWNDVIPVVAWGTMVMRLHAGVSLGDVVLVTNYRAKPSAAERCGLELALNPGTHAARLRVLSEEQLAFVGAVLPSPELRLLSVERLDPFPRGPPPPDPTAEPPPTAPPDPSDFDFVGLLRHVGRIERARHYHDPRHDPLAASDGADGWRAAGGAYPRFFAFRWLLLADASSEWDLPVRLHANSQWDLFARLRADRPLALTRLRLVRGTGPAGGLYAVSTQFTQILLGDRIPRQAPLVAGFLDWLRENQPAAMTRPWRPCFVRPADLAAFAAAQPRVHRLAFEGLQRLVDPLRWRERRRVLLTGIPESLQSVGPAPPPAAPAEPATPPPPPPPPPEEAARVGRGKGRRGRGRGGARGAARKRKAEEASGPEAGGPSTPGPSTGGGEPSGPPPGPSGGGGAGGRAAVLDLVAPGRAMHQELALAESAVSAPPVELPAGPSAWLAAHFAHLLPPGEAEAAAAAPLEAACAAVAAALAARGGPLLCAVDFSLEFAVPWPRDPAAAAADEDEDWDGDGGGPPLVPCESEEGELDPGGHRWCIELFAALPVPPPRDAGEDEP